MYNGEPILESEDVPAVGGYLQSSDPLIRRQAINLIPLSDLEWNLAQLKLLRGEGKTRKENVTRQMEIITRLVGLHPDGDTYARHVENIFSTEFFENTVHSNVISSVLTQIKDGAFART